MSRSLCDGLFHCPNHDDEENCPTKVPTTAQSTKSTTNGTTVGLPWNITTATYGTTTKGPSTTPGTTASTTPIPCNGYLCKVTNNFCISKRYIVNMLLKS